MPLCARVKLERHESGVVMGWKPCCLGMRLAIVLLTLALLAAGVPVVLGGLPNVGASDPVYDCSSVTSIPQAECQALVALWEQAGGSGWYDDCGWLHGDDPCAWHSVSGSNGVVCDAGHVTALRQVDNNLQGVIPAEIGNLDHIVILSMGANGLSGPIPDGIQNLTLLEELNLDGNALSGALPDALCSLVQLQFLNLNGNQFTQDVPACLGNLDHLVHLHVQDNSLTGGIPATLGNAVTLQSLRLSRNRLDGPVPSELGSLVALSVLTMGHNGLVGDLPESLTALADLELLDVTYNGLWASSDAVNAFVTARDATWEETQTVAPANLRVTGVTTSTVSLAWDAIPYAQDQGWYEVGVSEIPGGAYTSGGQTASKTDTALTVSGLSPGRTYYFAVRAFTDAHGTQQNPIWSPYSQEVSAMPGADVCDLVADVPASECQALVALYHRTEGEGWLQDDGWVQATTVGDWYGVGVSEGHVSSLSLHGNGLGGSLPQEIGNLGALEYLYLSHNQITGTIPLQIGQATSLKHLHLYRNRLGGEVPSEVGGLAVLRELKLGSNRLEGELPSTVASLPLLGDTSLDLGYNGLWAVDPTLVSFLDAHDPDWHASQTVAPTNVTATMELDTVVHLSWMPIDYVEDGGHYEVWYATDKAGPYTLHGVTSDKSAGQYALDELTPGTTYSIRVRSYTPPHGDQQNALRSGPSETVTATTYASFCDAVSELPAVECDALLALYDATQGEGWTSNGGWRATPTPCSWYGVTCENGHVDRLTLQHNHVVGSLPAQLGDLSELTWLGLYGNHMTGAIPAEVCALPNLTHVYLHNNALAGDVPSPFGANVSVLLLGNNMLEASDPNVQQYLEEKAPGWHETQTVPPAELRLGDVTSSAAKILWDPIAYTEDAGSYEVLYSWSAAGPYAKHGETTDKTIGSYTIDGVVRVGTMYVVVRTVTEPHGEQPNRLVSRESDPLSVPPSGSALFNAFIPLLIR